MSPGEHSSPIPVSYGANVAEEYSVAVTVIATHIGTRQGHSTRGILGHGKHACSSLVHSLASCLTSAKRLPRFRHLALSLVRRQRHKGGRRLVRHFTSQGLPRTRNSLSSRRVLTRTHVRQFKRQSRATI